MAQHLQRAIILHLFGVRLNLQPPQPSNSLAMGPRGRLGSVVSVGCRLFWLVWGLGFFGL